MLTEVLCDLDYQGFHLPAGTMSLVSPALSHRRLTVFRDPERRDPERFAPPREEHKQSAHALIGFGGGHHRCLGMHFAYLQIKALWTVLLSRFDGVPPVPWTIYGLGFKPCIAVVAGSVLDISSSRS